MKKLRIAVWHNLPSGGGKRQLYTHVKGLVERGHYVESWCPDTADTDFLRLGEIVTEHVVPLHSLSREINLAIRPAPVVEKLLLAMEDHCERCANEINQGGFDVLYANACMFLRTSPIAKYVYLPSTIYLGEPYRWFYEALPNLPWIGQHRSQEAIDSHGGYRRRLRDFVSRSIYRLISPRSSGKFSETMIDPVLQGARIQARAELEYARTFDSILVNSIYSRESILRAYNLPSRVCYLGIDTDYYKPTGEPKDRFVLGLGTIYYAKGIDRAIRAVAAIPIDERPRLIWIGNGASEVDLENYVNLAARLDVIFEAKIDLSDKEVISHLSRAAALIYTSRLEPFGLAPLEANACGTAVVGIAEAGIRETVIDGVNGFLAHDDTPSVLGKLIERIMANGDTGLEFGARAKEHVDRNWTVQSCIDNIENQLNALHADNKGKRVFANANEFEETLSSDAVHAHVDEFEICNGYIYARGWGFIEDCVMDGAQSFLLVSDGKRRELHRARMSPRRDVSEHFGKTSEYDNSGFIIDGRTQTKIPRSVKLIIVSERGTRMTSFDTK